MLQFLHKKALLFWLDTWTVGAEVQYLPFFCTKAKEAYSVAGVHGFMLFNLFKQNTYQSPT